MSSGEVAIGPNDGLEHGSRMDIIRGTQTILSTCVR